MAFSTSILVFIFFFWYLLHEYWVLKEFLFDLAFAFIAFGLFHPIMSFFLVATSPDLIRIVYEELMDLDSFVDETEC